MLGDQVAPPGTYGQHPAPEDQGPDRARVSCSPRFPKSPTGAMFLEAHVQSSTILSIRIRRVIWQHRCLHRLQARADLPKTMQNCGPCSPDDRRVRDSDAACVTTASAHQLSTQRCENTLTHPYRCEQHNGVSRAGFETGGAATVASFV